MQRLVTWPAFQAVAHEVAIEEDGGSAQSGLGQFEHHADLQDEIDTLASQSTLFFRRHAIDDCGRLEELVFGEDPLLFSFGDGGRRGARAFAHGRRTVGSRHGCGGVRRAVCRVSCGVKVVALQMRTKMGTVRGSSAGRQSDARSLVKRGRCDTGSGRLEAATRERGENHGGWSEVAPGSLIEGIVGKS